MKLTILYFAVVRELVGKDEEALDVPDAIKTIGSLGEHLEELHEPLRGRLGHVRFARNEEFVDARDVVTDGDTIALIPPVAGGA